MIYQVLNVLLVTAELDELFTQYCVEIFNNLPIVLPLNLFWIKGYHLQNFVLSCDNFTLSVFNIDMNGAKMTTPPGCRVKLFLVYVILILIHLIHYSITFSNFVDDLFHVNPPTGILWVLVFEYSIPILLTLILPIYCTFCWAVDYELKLFFEYVNVLIRGKIVPRFEHFDEFKRCYKKIADDIIFINQLFAIYLSVVLLIIGQVITGAIENLGVRVISLAIKAFTKDDEATEELTPVEVR